MSSPLKRQAELANLHPLMRAKAKAVESQCKAEGLPLRIFEAWRSPERQADLYAQGRTKPGKTVTYAEPWESYHQYGLAVDFVGLVDGSWTWNLPKAAWNRLHAIGAAHGLERLGFETPHLQVAGLSITRLMDGVYPDGGDESWALNISEAIARWSGHPKAPRPPMSLSGGAEKGPVATDGLDWSATPAVQASDWHARFGGREWRVDGNGIYLRDDPARPRRSKGAPVTCLAILDLYGAAIHKASLAHGVAPELIVMTIATETAFARQDDFTGPRTFRWEAHVAVRDVSPPDFGDYSAGPMQTLASTARDVIRRLRLGYDPAKAAPHIANQPASAPRSNPLYAGVPNIDIGTAEIRSRLGLTGGDPILVSAAYNAGGLYQSDLNAWRLRSTKDHLDRAAEWFGDACFILASLR